MHDIRNLRRGRARSIKSAIFAVGLVAGTAGVALAGDVTVTRVGGDVFIRGGSEGDHLVLSVAVVDTTPIEGVLRIASADLESTLGGTTVEGEAAVDVDLRPRDVVYLLLDGGNNVVTVDSLPRVRRLVQIGGSGADTLTLTGEDLRTNVLFVGQGGADLFGLAAGAGLDGDLVAVMGEGSDTFTASQAAITGTFVADLGEGDLNTFSLDRTSLGSSLTLLGGRERDVVSIQGCAVRRLARLDLGAGDDSVAIGSATRFEKRLQCSTGDGNDSVIVNGDAEFGHDVRLDLGEDNDSATLGAALFEGRLQVEGDDGIDTFSLTDFVVSRRLTVRCGASDDTVVLDTTAPVTLGNAGGLIDGGPGQDVIVNRPAFTGSVVSFKVFQTSP